MKRTITIFFLVLLLGTALFADATSNGPAKIKVSTLVQEFTVFGVSSTSLLPADYTSLANFSGAISSSINADVDMLQLGDEVLVGYLSAINSTKKTISLYIATTALATGPDPNDNRVGIHVRPNYYAIPPAKESKYGILESSTIKVIETTKGAALKAPAGTYTATIRITLVSGG